jgi:hypothetical protein
MMNGTDVVLISVLVEVAIMATSVVRANTAAGNVKEVMVARRDRTTGAGQARQGATACATLEKAAEAITVVITAIMDVDPQAQGLEALATIAAIPAVAWDQGVVTTRTGPVV